MKIGIIGYGHVGKAMHKLFTNAVIYDPKEFPDGKEKTNECEAVFVCVPTPSLPDGSCDTKIVEEVISWVKSKVIILRSTVRVGFTDEMMKKYKKEIVFQPEYYGETTAHPFADIKNQSWLSFGGTRKGINLAIKAYQTIVNSNVRIFQADAKTVEMAKYMENAYLATKVIFCNEMYDIAKSLGVDYNLAREIWLADPRIGSSHTFVYEDNRGYDGSCLPKDVDSIIAQAKENCVNVDFLKGIVRKNMFYKGAKYDLCLEQFNLHSLIGDKFFVLGIGGGNDAAGAFSVATIIKKTHPESKVIYGSCLSVNKKNYIGFSQISEGLYICDLKNSELNENHSLKLVQKLKKPGCDLGEPYVITASDERKTGRITKEAIDYFNEYTIITVDNGGDSLTGGKDGKNGFDHKNLMYLRNMKRSFLHIILGLGCDGESDIDKIKKMIQYQSQAIIGEFAMDEIANVLSPMMSDIGCPERKNVDTTAIILEANNHMLNNPKSEELYLIPRHERNIQVPYSWVNTAIVFYGQKLNEMIE